MLVRDEYDAFRRSVHTYVCISPWRRLVFEDGHLIGWYNPRNPKL